MSEQPVPKWVAIANLVVSALAPLVAALVAIWVLYWGNSLSQSKDKTKHYWRSA